MKIERLKMQPIEEMAIYTQSELDAAVARERASAAALLEKLIEEFENLTIMGSEEKRSGYETAMRTAANLARAAITTDQASARSKGNT